MNRRAITALWIIAILAIVVTPWFGPEPLRLDALRRGDSAEWNILLQLRLSRTLVAWLAGGSLALAGAIFQALLRNSLATPDTMGVSSGAALGAVAAICLHLPFVWLAALLGALFTLFVVLGMASRGRPLTAHALILAGISVAAVCSALITALHSYANLAESFSITTWLVGGIDAIDYRAIAFYSIAVLPVWALVIWYAPAWNLMAFGDTWAATRGVNVRRMTIGGYLAASWLAALTVSLTGPIAFIGLLIPHLVRESAGPDHRTLLPASIAGGAAFLACCDAVARTVFSPSDIPVGVITALLGGPGLIWILRREQR